MPDSDDLINMVPNEPMYCHAHSHKLSIEFVADDFMGSVIPSNWKSLTSNNATLEWNNTAHVVVTYPYYNTTWLNSQTFATASGAAYNSFVEDFLLNDEFIAEFMYFQPVSVINATTTTNTQDNDLFVPSLSLIPPVTAYSNSYTFIANLQHVLLTKYRVPFISFSKTYATSITYYVGPTTTVLSVKRSIVP